MRSGISEKSHILIGILAGLIVAGLVWGANTYYDLDLGKVIVEEITKIIGQLETTATTTLATVSGYVGIATTTLSRTLTISGDILVSEGIIEGANFEQLRLGVNDNLIEVLKGGEGPYIVCDSSGNCAGNYSYASATGTQNYLAKFTATSTLATSTVYELNGKIGIGTTSPSTRLEIEDNSGNPQLRLTYSGGNYADFFINTDGDLVVSATSGIFSLNTSGTQNYLRIYSTSTEYLQLTHTGSAGVLTVNSGNIEIGTQGSPVYIEEITEITANSTNTALTVTQSGTGYAATFMGGNVGIGTTTPSYRLTVSGDLYVSATSTLGSSTSTPTILTGYIKSDIIPYSDLTYNLGSSSYRWANLYVGTTTVSNSLGISSLTSGSVLFAGSGGVISQDNANFFWDDTNNRLGIGTSTPAYTLDVNGNIRATKSLTAGINVETLSGDKTLTPGTDEMYQYLDPNGDNRVITLATSTAKAGDRFIIRHNGAYDDDHCLQVKQGGTTLDYIYAGAIKEFIFDGTNWISAGIGAGEDDNKKYNVAIGYNAKGYNKGTAVGYWAYGDDYGVAVGYEVYAFDYGAGVGYGADAYNKGAAVGYWASAHIEGAAVGYKAYGESYGVAVGYYAWGYSYGAAVGYGATGVRYGAALGYMAGYHIDTSADRYNTLVGAYSGYQITTGKGNIILGYKSGYDSTYSPTTGSYNILIGYQAWTPSNDTSNFLNIGGLIFGTNLSTTTNTISSGNVGIGTTTPSAKLTVTQSGTGNIVELYDSSYKVLQVADGGEITAWRNATLTGGNLTISPLSPPTGLSVATSSSSGSCATSTTYYYRVTAVNPNGETLGCTEVSITTGADDTAIDISFNSVEGATGYKVYRSTSSISDGASVALVDNATKTTTSFTDDCSGDGTATIPSSNTTGGSFILTGGTTFPSSPQEGEMFFRTDTKQLYIYANGKWQADRTVATKIVAASDSQNKEKADYVCDGSNDEAEIEQAINDLPSTGGIVYLLEGTYNIGSSIDILKSNVSLIGSGKATILKRAWDASTNAGMITVGDGGTTAVSNIVIANLSIDGQKATYTGSENIGIFFNKAVFSSKIQNTWIYDNDGDGIYVTGAGVCATNRLKNIWIQDNEVSGNNQNGIKFDNSCGIGDYPHLITGNIIRENGSNGLYLYSGNYITVSHNIITNNTSRGIYVNDATYSIISNNRLYNNGDDEIDFYCWVEGNNCLLYTSPSPRDGLLSRMPSSA